MNEPGEKNRKSKPDHQDALSQDASAERRTGRDRRKGVDRRSGFDRRRDLDQQVSERKSITGD